MDRILGDSVPPVFDEWLPRLGTTRSVSLIGHLFMLVSSGLPPLLLGNGRHAHERLLNSLATAVMNASMLRITRALS
jgi:hypothetical protein